MQINTLDNSYYPHSQSNVHLLTPGTTPLHHLFPHLELRTSTYYYIYSAAPSLLRVHEMGCKINVPLQVERKNVQNFNFEAYWKN